MHRKHLLATAAAVVFGFATTGAFAADTVKIGFILPMTGQQQTTGQEIAAAIKLFQQQNGDTVAGKKVEVIIKDDAAVPDLVRALEPLVRGHAAWTLGRIGTEEARSALDARLPLEADACVREEIAAAISA